MPLEQHPTDPDKLRYVPAEYNLPKPWVDLTDEEITKTYWSREPFKRPTPIGFAREIEQLLKEKNT
jgi:hypothetical protein